MRPSTWETYSRCQSAGDDATDVVLTEAIAKLGDFGVSKVSSRAQTPVQTPHFMAPEVAKQCALGQELVQKVPHRFFFLCLLSLTFGKV